MAGSLRVLLWCLALSGASRTAGSPVQVNSDSYRDYNGVGLDGGNVVFTWQGDGDVLARVYTKDLEPVTGEFSFKIDGADWQGMPSATPVDSGFVVVWAVDKGDDREFYAQEFGVNGAKRGGAVPIFKGPMQDVQAPTTCRTTSGFATAWSNTGTATPGVFTQSYHTNGTALDPVSKASVDPGLQLAFVSYYPVCQGLANGGRVLAWHLNVKKEEFEIRGRVFDSDKSQGGELFVNHDSVIGRHSNPSVAVLEGGGFVIGWSFQDKLVFAQRYSANGEKEGPHIEVNPKVVSRMPRLAPTQGGGFVAIYEQGPVFTTICGNAYKADGTPRGSKTILHESSLVLMRPHIASAPASGCNQNFVLSWNVFQSGFAEVVSPWFCGDAAKEDGSTCTQGQ